MQLLTLTKFSGLWQTRLRTCLRGWTKNIGQNQRCIYLNWHGQQLMYTSSKAQLMSMPFGRQQLSMQPSFLAEYFNFQSLCCSSLDFLDTVSQLSNWFLKYLFQKYIFEHKVAFMQFTTFVYCKQHALKSITLLLLNARLLLLNRQKTPDLLYSAQF